MIEQFIYIGIIAVLGVLVIIPKLQKSFHRKQGHVRATIDSGNTIEHIWCVQVESFLVPTNKKDKRIWMINKNSDIKIDPKSSIRECFVLSSKPITIKLSDSKLYNTLEKAGFKNLKEVKREFLKIEKDEDGNDYVSGVKEEITIEGNTISLPQIENIIQGYTPKALQSYIKSEATAISLMTQPKDAAKTFLMVFLGVLLAIVIGYVIIKSNVGVSPETIVQTAKNVSMRA